jgi:hypothetical protein
MPLHVILPELSDFMEAAVIERIDVPAGDAFRRGDALLRLTVDMESEGDALACPPGLEVELVAAEPGVLVQWLIAMGDRAPAGKTLGTADSGGLPERAVNRPLRCVVREVLE